MAEVQNLSVKIFKNVSDNPKAPAFRGILCDPTQKDENGRFTVLAELSLWYADDKETGEQKLDKNGNPFLRGSSKAPYVKEGQA